LIEEGEEASASEVTKPSLFGWTNMLKDNGVGESVSDKQIYIYAFFKNFKLRGLLLGERVSNEQILCLLLPASVVVFINREVSKIGGVLS